MNFKKNISKYIKFLLSKLDYKLFTPNPYSIFDFESFLYRHLINHNNLTFVQIGANDGSLLDPLFKFNLKNKSKIKGWVIEPLPDLFEKLKKNYAKLNTVIPVNIAIHNSQDSMVMYRVNPKLLSTKHEFADAIASFDPNFYKKAKLNISESDIIESRVSCYSLDKFILEYNITNLDLLQIDTEGYDYEIIKNIDFTKLKPKIIRFEHGIRDEIMSEDQFLEVISLLNNNGYQIIAESYDATAYLLNSNDLIF